MIDGFSQYVHSNLDLKQTVWKLCNDLWFFWLFPIFRKKTIIKSKNEALPDKIWPFISKLWETTKIIILEIIWLSTSRIKNQLKINWKINIRYFDSIFLSNTNAFFRSTQYLLFIKCLWKSGNNIYKNKSRKLCWDWKTRGARLEY